MADAVMSRTNVAATLNFNCLDYTTRSTSLLRLVPVVTGPATQARKLKRRQALAKPILEYVD